MKKATAKKTKTASKPKKRTQGMNWIRKPKRLAIYSRDGFACVYCGRSVEDGIGLSLDHITPYSLGGKNTADNLVTCCGTCNSSRGNRSVEEFAEKAAGYYNIMTADQIMMHIEDCVSRPLDVEGAKEIMSRRASWTELVKNNYR